MRIEDTDRTRFVEGAEDYIIEALNWCGLTIDESDAVGGDLGPYKQSNRSQLYEDAVAQLLAAGKAYRAFDTPEELSALRKDTESRKEVFQYDAKTRGKCRNELSMSKDDVDSLIENGAPHVVRFKTPDTPEKCGFH